MTELQRWRKACRRFARAMKMMRQMSTMDDEYGVLRKIERNGVAAMASGRLDRLEKAVEHPWRGDW